MNYNNLKAWIVFNHAARHPNSVLNKFHKIKHAAQIYLLVKTYLYSVQVI